MKQFALSIFLISALSIAATHGSSESDSSEEEDRKAQSMYRELYCQTDLVLKEKLIEVPENTENGYKILAGDDVDQLDCQPVVAKLKKKIYEELKKKHKKNKNLKKSADCSMKKYEEHGYDKLRFKLNSLLGLGIPSARKNELRAQFNQEIAEVIEKSVDECSSGGTTNLPIDVRGEFDDTVGTPSDHKKKESLSDEQ